MSGQKFRFFNIVFHRSGNSPAVMFQFLGAGNPHHQTEERHDDGLDNFRLDGQQNHKSDHRNIEAEPQIKPMHHPVQVIHDGCGLKDQNEKSVQDQNRLVGDGDDQKNDRRNMDGNVILAHKNCLNRLPAARRRGDAGEKEPDKGVKTTMGELCFTSEGAQKIKQDGRFAQNEDEYKKYAGNPIPRVGVLHIEGDARQIFSMQNIAYGKNKTK